MRGVFSFNNIRIHLVDSPNWTKLLLGRLELVSLGIHPVGIIENRLLNPRTHHSALSVTSPHPLDELKRKLKILDIELYHDIHVFQGRFHLLQELWKVFDNILHSLKNPADW